MSRINVENIRHPDAASDSLQLSNTGNITAPGNLSVTGTSTLTGNTVVTGSLTANGLAYPSAGPLSNRNLIINGAMQVAQRGTQVTGITNSGYRTVDRFRPSMGTLGTWTIEQSTDAPDGFAFSHKFTCTTADASPAAGDDIEMEYRVEARDLQHLNYGSASAQAMTLSFWVKSNKTGTATVNILQPDNSNKSLSPTYTISSADTWEHKTISIPGDTAGVINNDNGNGLWFLWWLNSGSNFNSGTNRTTWTTLDSADRNASNLGVGGAVDDYWQITGVQLEVGSVATPFEHRSFGDELARCQRYFEKTFATDTAPAQNLGRGGALETLAVRPANTTGLSSYFRFTVPKRATPSMTYFNPGAANAQARNLDIPSDCSNTGTDNMNNIGGKVFLYIAKYYSVYASNFCPLDSQRGALIMTYQITLDYFGKPNGVRQLSNQLCIPFDPDNTDYQEYLEWLAEGNTPLPADE